VKILSLETFFSLSCRRWWSKERSRTYHYGSTIKREIKDDAFLFHLFIFNVKIMESFGSI